MKAIILAAGEGIRLRPFTLDRPKCLVEVDGVSLLDRQIDVLHSEGIHKITLIGGYRGDMLSKTGLGLRLNKDYAKTNMLWSLFCAEDLLEGDLLLAYGDIVYSKDILVQLLASTADIAVCVDLNWHQYWSERNDDPLSDAESLRIDKNNNILEIGQKPSSLAQIDAQYMGLIKLSGAGANLFRQNFHKGLRSGSINQRTPEKAYMTDLLQMMINEGCKLSAVKIKGSWVEVDTVKDLNLDITKTRLKSIKSDLNGKAKKTK